MAAIDKIYGTKEQREELGKYLKENLPTSLKYLYRWYPEWNDGNNHSISNFPEWMDKWLLINCPLTWVTDYIKDQYGLTE